MFDIEAYLSCAIGALRAEFGDRLVYLGLQGGYARGEASERSDVDLMAVLDTLSVPDLDRYRAVVRALPGPDSCGFICGLPEMRAWNACEVMGLLGETRDLVGNLCDILPPFTDRDVRNHVKLSAGDILHALCHKRIHGQYPVDIPFLAAYYKQVFYILQKLHWLDTGVFVRTKSELLNLLSGIDQQTFEIALRFKNDDPPDLEEGFERLFDWCQSVIRRT